MASSARIRRGVGRMDRAVKWPSATDYSVGPTAMLASYYEYRPPFAGLLGALARPGRLPSFHLLRFRSGLVRAKV